MSAHTKGPWVISGGGSLHLSVLSQDDEQTIADVWFIRRDPEEGNANARLIAAAPELLEALRQLLHSSGLDERAAAQMAAHAAIHKATGGSA